MSILIIEKLKKGCHRGVITSVVLVYIPFGVIVLIMDYVSFSCLALLANG